MRLPKTEYIKALSINEVIANLAEADSKAKILAGGTDLLVNMKHRLEMPEILIGIKSIPELSSLSKENGMLKIGSAFTLSNLLKKEEIKNDYPILYDSIKSLASMHIRNTATIGGNICLNTRCWYYNQPKLWRDGRELCHKTGGTVCHAIKKSGRCYAINSSDTAPVMIALDAEFTLTSKEGERKVKATDFFKDNGKSHIDIANDELLTSITIPSQREEKTLTYFHKISSRRGIDFGYGNVAISLKGEKNKGYSEAKIVIGAMTSAPVLLKKAASIIAESGITKKSIEEASNIAATELGTLTNLFTSAGYKRKLASALVKKALEALSEK